MKISKITLLIGAVFLSCSAPSIKNKPPIIKASEDQKVQLGEIVTLKAHVSDPDHDHLHYHWIFLKKPLGSKSVIKNPNQISTSFYADKIGKYHIRLKASDKKSSVYRDFKVLVSDNRKEGSMPKFIHDDFYVGGIGNNIISFGIKDKDLSNIDFFAKSSDQSIVPNSGISISLLKGNLLRMSYKSLNKIGNINIKVIARNKEGIQSKAVFRIQIIQAIGGRVGFDEFGYSTDIFKNYLAVGQPGINTVSIFKHIKDNWILQGQLTLPQKDMPYPHRFGESVSLFGKYAVIGTHANQKVYVFERYKDTWTQTNILTLTPEDHVTSEDHLRYVDRGKSLSIYDSYFVVGDPDKKTAYVFKYNGKNWENKIIINKKQEIKDDYFGRNAAIYKDYIIITGSKKGTIYIFKRNKENWTYQTTIKSESCHTRHIDIFKDYIISSNCIFKRDGEEWIQHQKIDSSASALVAISDNYAISGLKLYKRIEQHWSFMQPIKSLYPDKRLGDSAAISDDYAVLGTSWTDIIGVELLNGYASIYPLK